MVYKNIVSLGSNCCMAAALEKNGFRSFSGPFDWVISSLEGVLNMVESGFKDVIDKNNISVVESNDRLFYDSKYDILYPHDVEKDLEMEFEDIRLKYNRRGCALLDVMSTPTLFVRLIRDRKELDYIKANKDRIYNIIKNKNSNNNILFIGYKWMEADFKCIYNVYLGQNPGGLYDILDYTPGVIGYLNNHYDEGSKEHNLEYTFRRNPQRFYGNKEEIIAIQERLSRKYNIVANYSINKSNLYSSKNPNVAIYGAALVGKEIYERIKNECNVVAFFDRNAGKGQVYQGIPILQPNGLDASIELSVIVTPDAFTDIKMMLESYYTNIKVHSWREVFLEK